MFRHYYVIVYGVGREWGEHLVDVGSIASTNASLYTCYVCRRNLLLITILELGPDCFSSDINDKILFSAVWYALEQLSNLCVLAQLASPSETSACYCYRATSDISQIANLKTLVLSCSRTWSELLTLMGTHDTICGYWMLCGSCNGLLLMTMLVFDGYQTLWCTQLSVQLLLA